MSLSAKSTFKVSASEHTVWFTSALHTNALAMGIQSSFAEFLDGPNGSNNKKLLKNTVLFTGASPLSHLRPLRRRPTAQPRQMRSRATRELSGSRKSGVGGCV